MEQDQLHLPDFTAPDFTQPTLARTDLAQPDFVLLDPTRSELQHTQHMPPWPEDMSRPPADERPDPALPDLLAPDRPGHVELSRRGRAHVTRTGERAGSGHATAARRA
jgi:hypothetical protein